MTTTEDRGGTPAAGLAVDGSDEVRVMVRSRRRVWVTVAVVAVLALAGAVVATAVWNARENAAHDLALSQWREARELLAADVQLAEVILDAAQDAGIDPEDLGALHAALDDADGLNLSIDPALSRSEDIERTREVLVAIDAARLALNTSGSDLRDRTAVHRAEQSITSLDAAAAIVDTAEVDLAGAEAELAETLGGARELLAASEATIPDHLARVALTEAIDAAVAQAAEVDAARVQIADVIERHAQLRATLEQVVASPSSHTGPTGTGPDYVADTRDELAAAEEAAAAASAHAGTLRVHVHALGAARQAVHDAETAATSATQSSESTTPTNNGPRGGRARGSGTTTTTGSGGAQAPAAKPGTASTPTNSGTETGKSIRDQMNDLIEGGSTCIATDDEGNSWLC